MEVREDAVSEKKCYQDRTAPWRWALLASLLSACGPGGEARDADAGVTRDADVASDAVSEDDGNAQRSLMADLERARAVAWVAPHPDDEILSSGLLAQSSLGLGRSTFVVSLRREAVATEPGTPEDRLVDNQDSRDFLQLADYVYASDTLASFPGDSVQERLTPFMDEFIASNQIDVLLTFENTHGYNGHEDHIAFSQWLTAFAAGRDVQLYYFINRDPLFNRVEPDHALDPLPVTDTLDLSTEVTREGVPLTLWEAKVAVLEIYSSSQPGAHYFVNLHPELMDEMLREESYRRVF